MPKWRTTGHNQWPLYYSWELDGGGTAFGQEYVELIEQRYGPKQTVFEWCSGPAFIGLNLLDHQLADRLVVCDLHEPALRILNWNLARNRITDLVQSYHTDRIATIPAHKQFDLVVGNPPHFLRHAGDQRRCVDLNWQTHWEFFRNIAKHLNADSHILLQENDCGSPNRQRPWQRAIDQGGLEVTDIFNSPTNYKPQEGLGIYYIELRLRTGQ
jgi:methylase of polypeptide subunit release factors